MSLNAHEFLDLDMHQGEDLAYDVVVYQDDDGLVPQPITGATIIAQMRDRAGGTLLLAATVTITSGAGGAFTVRYPGGTGAGTTGIVTQDGVHDCFVTTIDGVTHIKPIMGKIRLIPRVSTP